MRLTSAPRLREPNLRFTMACNSFQVVGQPERSGILVHDSVGMHDLICSHRMVDMSTVFVWAVIHHFDAASLDQRTDSDSLWGVDLAGTLTSLQSLGLGRIGFGRNHLTGHRSRLQHQEMGAVDACCFGVSAQISSWVVWSSFQGGFQKGSGVVVGDTTSQAQLDDCYTNV